MKTSATGIQFIFLHEVDPAERQAASFKAFLDTIAQPPVWTIGVGHTSAAGPPAVFAGQVISRSDAMAILASDLAGCETRVTKRLGAVPQQVFDAAVSFDFNTGGILTASWCDSYLFGNLPDAEVHFKLWNKAGGKTVQGLVNRRADEWKLLSTGDYGAGVAVQPAPPPKPQTASQAPVPPPPDVPPVEPLPSPPASPAVSGVAIGTGLAALLAAGAYFEHAILHFFGF